MKSYFRILLILLLFPFIVFADVDVRDGVIIDTTSTIDGIVGCNAVDGQTIVVAGGGTTCSSCTPGDPADVFCEDCENSGAFWCSVTESVDGTNDVSCAAHSGTLTCTDKGSYAIQVDVDGGQGDMCYIYMTVSEDTIYVRGRFNFISWDGEASGDNVTLVTLANGTTILSILRLRWNGSNFVIRFAMYGQEAIEYNLGPSLSLGTWYDFYVSHTRNTTDGATCYVNGSDVSANAGYTSQDLACTRVYFGSIPVGDMTPVNLGTNGIDFSSDVVQYQFDIIEADDDTLPSTCPTS